MATISIAFLLQRVAVNLQSFTGGNNGVFGIPPLTLGSVTFSGEKQYFVLSWSIVLVLFVLGRNIAGSRFGRALAAIHKDEDAAATLGVNALRYKATLWLIACIPPALAGTLFAHYSAFVSPDDFGLTASLTLFVAVLLGGERSIFSALVALVFLVTLPSFASTGVFTTDMIKGLGLIVVYMISPTGLAGLVTTVLRRRRKGAGRA
jgi:branched-chain amino acid transport system permease protein